MNERILELREQAWALVSDEERDRGELYETRVRWERCDQKFAELIVGKCVDIANKQFSAASGLDDRDCWTAAEMKKHFGVEE